MHTEQHNQQAAKPRVKHTSASPQSANSSHAFRVCHFAACQFGICPHGRPVSGEAPPAVRLPTLPQHRGFHRALGVRDRGQELSRKITRNLPQLEQSLIGGIRICKDCLLLTGNSFMGKTKRFLLQPRNAQKLLEPLSINIIILRNLALPE